MPIWQNSITLTHTCIFISCFYKPAAFLIFALINTVFALLFFIIDTSSSYAFAIPFIVFLNCTANRMAVNVTAIVSAIGSAR